MKNGKGLLKKVKDNREETYDGYFADDLYHGEGSFKNESINFKGFFQKGLRHGKTDTC